MSKVSIKSNLTMEGNGAAVVKITVSGEQEITKSFSIEKLEAARAYVTALHDALFISGLLTDQLYKELRQCNEEIMKAGKMK